MTFKDHFSTAAGDYARFRPGYPDALFAWLAERAPARRRAWDCATGNGQAAHGLAGRFDQVVASDASASQLARATADPRIAYVVCVSEVTPFAGRCFDAVLIAQALHWLDLDRFYREVRRVARPGCVLAACSYTLAGVEPAVDEVVMALYDRVLGPYWPVERHHVERGYRDLSFPFPPLAPPPLELCRDWTLAELTGYLGTWSATRRYRVATGRDPVAAVAGDLAAAWGNPECRRRVRWPLNVIAGRVSPGSHG